MSYRFIRLIVVSLTFMFVVNCGQPAPVPFDGVVWQQHAADVSPTNPRRAMAHALVQHNSLLGKTRAEILTMLGQPMHDSQIKTLYFVVGQLESGELVSLAVNFEHDRVAKTFIHTF